MSKKWFMGRSSMAGDNLAALVTARFVKKFWPSDPITWGIGKKCSSLTPLLNNHPDLDKIFVTDGLEGLESARDFAEFDSCDYRLNLNPPHYCDNAYPKKRDIFFESFLMAGFSPEQWGMLSDEDKVPKLVKWWNPVQRPFGAKKTVFFTGRPNFGRETRRCVSPEYSLRLVKKLMELGYAVIQSGGENDPAWFEGWVNNPDDPYRYLRVNERSFFEQIQIANECDCVVGSDSGASLICGAYFLQQVSLITLHWGNTENPTALSTNNPNNHSFYSFNGTDNIDLNSVVDKIIEKTTLKP